MPAVELVALLDGLWGAHEENTARLLEAQAYWLQLHWNDRDPDLDPDEIEAERARAEAAGVPRPPFPPVPPVAERPHWIQTQRFDEFADRVEPYQLPGDDSDDEIPDDENFLSTWLDRSGYG